MQEEVNDVEIETDSGMDVLFGGDTVADHVRVEYNEHWEDHSSSNTNGQVHHLRLEKQLIKANYHSRYPH